MACRRSAPPSPLPSTTPAAAPGDDTDDIPAIVGTQGSELAPHNMRATPLLGLRKADGDRGSVSVIRQPSLARLPSAYVERCPLRWIRRSAAGVLMEVSVVSDSD